MPPVPTAGERAKPTRKTAARAAFRERRRRALTEAQLDRLVNALEAARDGDFSVRLRADGPLADVAAAFNALVERNQQVTRELVRVSKVVGREGRITERAGVAGAPGSWAEKVGAVNELIDNLARPTIEVARVIDAVADGDLPQRIQLEIDGQPVRGEFRRIGTTVNGDGRPALELRRRGHARRARGRHRGQARRPGAGQGRLRHLEGPDRLGQPDGLEPDRPGAEHRRGDDRGRERRPLEEGHRRRQGRGARAEEHRQHDGRPALALRRRGHARRPRGRHGRQARRPGPGQGRLRRLEGPDREREHARRQPHRPGAQHRRRHDRGRERRPLEEDHRRRQGRGARAEGDHQHDGRPAALVLGRGDARREGGRHRGQARRPGPGRGRLRRLEGPDREREHARRQPHRPGAEHRRGDDRGRERRPLEEDHRRRPRRGARAEGDRQHDGRPAALVRRRGHPRRARGRHRGPASAARPRSRASPASGRT